MQSIQNSHTSKKSIETDLTHSSSTQMNVWVRWKQIQFTRIQYKHIHNDSTLELNK